MTNYTGRPGRRFRFQKIAGISDPTYVVYRVGEDRELGLVRAGTVGDESRPYPRPVWKIKIGNLWLPVPYASQALAADALDRLDI